MAALELHPFYKIHKLLEEVKSVFEILTCARNEVIKVYGIFLASIRFDGFNDRENVELAATAAVFQFSFAAASLVSMYRRLKSEYPSSASALDDLKARCFPDRGLSTFVQELRNSYGHRRIFKVQKKGNMRFAERVEIDANLNFNSQELLRNSDWGVDAKSFLLGKADVDVLDAIEKYYQSAKHFHQKYVNAAGIGDMSGALEFARLSQLSEINPKIAWLKIMGQIAKDRGSDPYDFLTSYFSDSEIGRINCFPRRSKEQVDFMITISDPLSLCDFSLRKMLYDLFSVEFENPKSSDP